MGQNLIKYFLAGFLCCFISSNGAVADSIQYTYDGLNRLVKVQYDNGAAIEYTYDLAGNRLTKSVTAAPTETQGSINTLSPVSRLFNPTPSPAPFSGQTFPGTPFGSEMLSGTLVKETLCTRPQGGEVASLTGEREEFAAALRETTARDSEIAPVTEAARQGDPGPAAAGVPAPPGGLGVLAAADKVVLVWKHSVTDKVGFIIQRQEGADREKFSEIARLASPLKGGAGGFIWTDKAVRPGLSYRYRVAAYNAAGISSFCPPLEVSVK